MTAPRRPRSAWLLVGSTPSVWLKVQSAGQRLSRLLGELRGGTSVRGLLRAACSSSARSFVLERRDLALGAGPGRRRAGRLSQAAKSSCAIREAGVAELLLLAHAFAVGGEVAEQVRPAELPSGRDRGSRSRASGRSRRSRRSARRAASWPRRRGGRPRSGTPRSGWSARPRACGCRRRSSSRSRRC